MPPAAWPARRYSRWRRCSRWRWGLAPTLPSSAWCNAVLLKPLPFAEPDRLVGLWQTAPGVNITDLSASIADYVTYREESRTLEDVAIWNRTALTVTGLGEPERVDAHQRHLPAAADAGRPADPRQGVRGARQRGEQPRGRDARAWLLAAAVRWRSGRRRAADQGRWHPARDRRCAAAGLLVHGRAARSRAAAPLRPRQGAPRRLQLPGGRPAAPRRQHRGHGRGRRAHDPDRAGQVSAAPRHEREDDGGRAARPQRPSADRRSRRRRRQEPLGGDGDDWYRPADRLRQRRQSPARENRGACPGARRPRGDRRGARPPGPGDAGGEPVARRPGRRRRPGFRGRGRQDGPEHHAGPAAAPRADWDRCHVAGVYAGPLRARRPGLWGHSGAETEPHPAWPTRYERGAATRAQAAIATSPATR